MHPPSWVCQTLHRIHPKLRLAWHGREKTELADINAGSFALIQLFPSAIVGPLSDPNIFSELWEVSPRMVGGRMQMVKVDRGPIFNRHGTTTRDYDPITEVPVYLIDLNGLGFDKYRVCNGDFLVYLPRWMTPAKKRMKESLEAKYKQQKSELKDVSGEAADFLWHQANKTGATSPVVPWEFAKDDVKKMYEKNEHRKLESAYSLKDKL